jgi:hypothetical protein
MLTEAFDTHVDKACPEEFVSKRVDRQDNVDAIIDGFDQPSQLVDGGRVEREGGRDRRRPGPRSASAVPTAMPHPSHLV